MPIFQADGGDLSAVSAFLDAGRRALARIEFFYPYKEEELVVVLEKGCFLCAADGEKIAGCFALDTDKTYGAQLARTVRECTRGALAPRYAYETSGLMVDAAHRRRGIAGALADAVMAEAQKRVPHDFLCGVVQLENIASMSVFLSRGFVLAGVYAMGGEYDFGYFVRPAAAPLRAEGKEGEEVPFRDMDGHKRALAQGRVGAKLTESGIVYLPLKKEEKS